MSKESDNLLQVKINQLKSSIRESGDLIDIAIRCGMEYKEGIGTQTFIFSIFDIPVELKYPELIVRDDRDGKILNIAYQALVCYYLLTSATISINYQLESKWVSFADLPDGRFYNQAFQGYTGDKLAAAIQSEYNNFSNIAKHLNGSILDIGDSAYQFLALPKVPIAVVFWYGDEEFPTSCKILFDSTVKMYLPTDTCAIIGSMLTNNILKHLVE